MFYPTSPDKEVYIDTGERLSPIQSLVSDCGQKAHICQHHNCLVLVVWDTARNLYKTSPYIFREAWKAMRNIEEGRIWKKTD